MFSHLRTRPDQITGFIGEMLPLGGIFASWRELLTIVRGLLVRIHAMLNAPRNEPILGLSEALAGELVYRLCIAECAGLDRYRAEVTKLESSTASGNRYIRVRLPVDVSTSSFIPNHQTLICVSAKYIPLSRLKEHCIQREYLDTFSTKRGAAYILASTRQGMQNLSAAAYRDQMRASVTDQIASTSHLAVDAHFYSRETLEAWLREQPTVASWLGQRFAALERQLSSEKSARSDNVIYSTRLQRSP